MEDQHKRITQAQFDIWVDSPVTKVYLQCLKWSAEQIQEAIGKGGFVDSTNNDLSMNQLHSALGEQGGLRKAADPKPVLEIHALLEEEIKEDEIDK